MVISEIGMTDNKTTLRYVASNSHALFRCDREAVISETKGVGILLFVSMRIASKEREVLNLFD